MRQARSSFKCIPISAQLTVRHFGNIVIFMAGLQSSDLCPTYVYKTPKLLLHLTRCLRSKK